MFMRRPSPVRVPSQSQRLGFETLESRDLLAADVGLDWWAEPADFGSADDWSWTFDESWAGDIGADQAWDDGWWVEDVSWNDGSWNDGSWPPADDSGSDGAWSDWFDWTEQPDGDAGDAGWVSEEPAADPSDTPAEPIDVVTTPPDGPETMVVVVAPADDPEADQSTLLVDAAVPPPAVAFEDSNTVVDPVTSDESADAVEESRDAAEVWDTNVVGIADEADTTITDVTADTTSDDASDLVFDTTVDGDTTESWVVDTTPSDESADDTALPGTGTVDTRADLPVAVTSSGVAPAPVPSSPLVGTPASPVLSAANGVPASRFAGWGAFFMPLFGGRDGAGGTAFGGQADSQPTSGRPRIRLPFRPVV